MESESRETPSKRMGVHWSSFALGSTAAVVFLAALAAGFLVLRGDRSGVRPTGINRPESLVPPDALVLSLRNSIEKKPTDTEATVALARLHFVRGEVSESLAAYMRALEINPKNSTALAELAFLLYRGKLADVALKTVNKALDADPDHPTALWVKAQILFEKGDDFGAINVWQRFLKVLPNGVYADHARQSIEHATARMLMRRR